MSPEQVPRDLVAKGRKAVVGKVQIDDTADIVRTALAAVLPDIQAQALREASTQVLVLGVWSGSSINVGERAAQWLRDRAARLTETTECCDHQAMENGNCSDCLNTGHAHDPNEPCQTTEEPTT